MATITGTNGNDNLTGTAGSDTINPLLGRDTVDGLGDSDTLIVDYSSASIDPYAGASVANVPSVIFSNGGSFSGAVKTVDGGNYVTFTSIEHLQVKLDFWHNTFILDGSALALGATIVLDGGAGTDTLEANLSALASVDLQFGPGGTTASFGTIISFEVFRLNLTEGADNVTTGAGNDTLTGNGGDDVLNSGGGNDILSGGTGSNILNAGDGDDTIASTGIDTVDGGSGGFNFDRWSGDYGSSTANLTFIRDTAAGTGTLSNGTTLSGIESITALTTGSGDDVFTFTTPEGYIEQFLIAAGAGEDSLTFAGSGYSGLISADGAGAFAGNLGSDRFSGIEHLSFVSGSFADSITVNAAPLLAGATLVLNGAGGIDTLAIDFTAFASISFVVAADGSVTVNTPATLVNFERYQITSGAGADNITTGNGDDVVQANGGNDAINTAGGNDLLDGGSGADAMAGGSGNDTYVVDEAGDTVAENAGEGIDEIRTGLASFSLAPLANVENLTGTSAAGQSLTGNGSNNAITGGSGNDLIDGLAGGDVMAGRAGDDRYSVDNAADVVIEFFDQGRDVIYSSVSYTLGTGTSVEALSTDSIVGTAAINLTGNELNNEIYGNSGANTLNGGGGGDYLVGWGGDDTYLIFSGSEIIVENVNGGRDVVYTSVSYRLAAGTQVEVLAANSIGDTTSINLTGNELNNEIYGNNGANMLNGGGGAGDYLVGFGGNDTYLIFTGGEIIVENVGGGRDVVYTAVSYALAAGTYVEALSTNSIAGTNAINLTGNSFNNEIYGNNGANTLNGGGGGDYLVGWGGDDTYLIFSGSEIIVENVNGGRDVVYTTVSYGIAAGTQVEVLSTDSIAGTNAINLTGNELNNEIYGNNGANTLNGGGGAGDYLVGWGGDDTYLIFTGGEIIIENAGGGRDVVYSTVSYALAAGTSVEVLSTNSIGGTSGISLTGNELGQEVYGNNGANTLNGGAGGDYMAGFGGADSFAFTTALGSGNVDHLADFSAVDDTILLENAVFTGLANGALPASAFVAGSAAADADDRIVYNSATGQIFFDADGNGSGAQVLFATVNAGTILTASDFMVI